MEKLKIWFCKESSLFLIEGRLKSSEADQDTLIEYNQTRIIFQHIFPLPCYPYTSSIVLQYLDPICQKSRQ